jgi:predicted RNA binding protein YcfA (HicA-like mRNA interferase family)
VKVRDVIKLIEADGWYFLRQRGSHRQYRHATKPGKVTVAGKPSEEMAPGTLGSIFRQAGIDRDEEKEEDQ